MWEYEMIGAVSTKYLTREIYDFPFLDLWQSINQEDNVPMTVDHPLWETKEEIQEGYRAKGTFELWIGYENYGRQQAASDVNKI